MRNEKAAGSLPPPPVSLDRAGQAASITFGFSP